MASVHYGSEYWTEGHLQMMDTFIIRKSVFKVMGHLVSTYYYWFSGESRLQAIYSHFDFWCLVISEKGK